MLGIRQRICTQTTSHQPRTQRLTVRRQQMIRIRACALVFGTCLVAAHADAAMIEDPGQGPVAIEPSGSGASELSGLTWIGDADFAAVSDDTSGGGRVFGLQVVLDSSTGEIQLPAAVVDTLELAAGQDLEGIAFDAIEDTFVVSDEIGPTLHIFDRSTGALEDVIAVPDVFVDGLRSNLGLESLTRTGDGELWTANEEALTSDGEVASFTSGTIVRLQRFAQDHTPNGQWGYVTDAITADIFGSAPGRDIERSGVVDLAVLDDGAVLVLERMLGGNPSNSLPIFRIRLYEVDLSEADDTSNIDSLSPGSFQPAGKTLLWEASFDALAAQHNFEGLAIGPLLDTGARALLLISDDAGFGGASQALYALTVQGDNEIFSDDFESGDTGRWSAATPGAASR